MSGTSGKDVEKELTELRGAPVWSSAFSPFYDPGHDGWSSGSHIGPCSDRRMETNTKVGGAEKKEPGSLMVELSSHHGLFMFGLVLQERN